LIVRGAQELYCLVSIGSSLFTKDVIGRLGDWAAHQDLKVRFVILSEPERHNIKAFEKVGYEKAAALAEDRADIYAKEYGLTGSSAMTWGEICRRLPFETDLKRIQEYYGTNKSFQRNCLSHTFSNLQPRFRRHGVRKKSHPLVQEAVYYLLEELAIKVGAFESGEFAGEIIPHDEMEITKAIYSGSYFSCTVSATGFRVISMTPSGISQTEYTRRSDGSQKNRILTLP
jgi:tRNA-dependent cyclodipeptide synthase